VIRPQGPALSLPSRADDPLLDGWYQTIELGNGLVSRGHYDHRPVVDRYGIPNSLAEQTALDVGTAEGFFAFELERRGARRVVATDVARIGDCDWLPFRRSRLSPAVLDSTHWPARFHMAQAMRKSRVEYRFTSVYDLRPEVVGLFDVVFCGSLLLHLQSPLLALQRIRSVTREMAIIETAVDVQLESQSPERPALSFGFRGSEKELGEANSYWLFTSRALEDMLLYAGFASAERRGLFDLSPKGPTVTAVVARVG
jgi:tRNA (mo5U34)-methyltransferase